MKHMNPRSMQPLGDPATKTHTQGGGSTTSIKSVLAQSVSGHSRRHSLPLHFLPPNLWSANTSRASLVESEEAARGEHILDEATIAHRISALRQLNGATRNTHQYAKSTGARNSTFSQPVIVRTYSGTRPQSRQREPPVKKEMPKMENLELPPIEAFTFKGIMDSIQSNVADDLERIAEICARSRYSLSNQYEAHMPPHGEGNPFLRRPGQTIQTGGQTGGPTLQAIVSDDEQTRSVGRSSRGGARRTKSMAYGTLETIMSSSRSSEEDKAKKKSAAVLAEEVRGRAMRKASIDPDPSTVADGHVTDGHVAEPCMDPPRRPGHIRSRSATFASMIIDNAQSFRADSTSQLVSPTSLISEPARPKTSISIDQDASSLTDTITLSSPTMDQMSAKLTLIRNDSRASTLRPESIPKPTVLGSLTSWLPWARPTDPSSEVVTGRARSLSHAEGSLRELLKSTDYDRKGKGVDRGG